MRGVILSVEDRFTYVLDETGAFRRIYSRSSHKAGGEIKLIEARSGGRRRSRILSFSAVAACFVILVGGFSFASSWDGTAYALYIDINPSVRFEVNNFDQVISQQSLNEDGAELLNSAKPNGYVMSALGSLVADAQESGTITEYGVAVTMVGGSNEKFQKLSEMADSAFSLVNVHLNYMTEQEESLALKHDATPHQFYLAKGVCEKYPDIGIEDALKMPMDYLNELLEN